MQPPPILKIKEENESLNCCIILPKKPFDQVLRGQAEEPKESESLATISLRFGKIYVHAKEVNSSKLDRMSVVISPFHTSLYYFSATIPGVPRYKIILCLPQLCTDRKTI